MAKPKPAPFLSSWESVQFSHPKFFVWLKKKHKIFIRQKCFEKFISNRFEPKMFQIYKNLSLTRKIPQVSWIRNYRRNNNPNKADSPCPPRYECKQPEPHESELIYAEMKKLKIPGVFLCKSHKDYRIFRNIFFFICLPAMVCAYINIFCIDEEHRERPRFVPYSYLRIRRKGYAWDPQRTLFHNPDYNALPDGYETTFPPEREYDPMDKYPCPVPKQI